MLETIREFASGRLESRGEEDALRERHATYFEDHIAELRARLAGETHPSVMGRLDDDWDDVLASMDWWIGRREYARVARLASRIWRYVWLRDRVGELTTRLQEVYSARATLEPALRGELCRLWGSLCYQTGDYETAREVIEEAVELLSEHGPRDREAWAHALLGGVLPYFDGDLELPLAEVSRAVELFREDDNAFGLATTLGMIGTISALRGHPDEAMAQLDEGIAVAEKLGLPELIGANHTLRALAHLACDQIEDARRHLDAAAGTSLYLESTTYSLEGYAAVLLEEGDSTLAATMLGAAEGLRERTGIQMWPIMGLILRDRLAALESAGPDAAAGRFAGREMSPTAALALVRAR